MGRKLTVTLAIALLTFVLAPLARADSITTPSGLLIIPDGSQVTSVFVVPMFGSCFNIIGVDFQFQGGTGSTISCTNVEGNNTNITFTVPVTDLSLTAIIPPEDNAGLSALSADGVGVFAFACSNDPFPNPLHPCPGTIDLTLSGPISDLFLFSFETFSGIESLSFTVDAGDPPTSSLIFLGVGLIGLLVSSRRKVPICP
jgi:hypothetical protein